MLLSGTRLIELVESGVIDADLSNVNGASIDITLDTIVMCELAPACIHTGVDLEQKESLNMIEVDLMETRGEFLLRPKSFILASSRETFNLPANIAAEYKLKSSLARCGLQHMLAGWCDPTWSNSKLTLEFYNVTRHTLKLRAGMKIGQIVFFECDTVPENLQYLTNGQYNNQTKVTPSKGAK